VPNESEIRKAAVDSFIAENLRPVPDMVPGVAARDRSIVINGSVVIVIQLPPSPEAAANPRPDAPRLKSNARKRPRTPRGDAR